MICHPVHIKRFHIQCPGVLAYSVVNLNDFRFEILVKLTFSGNWGRLHECNRYPVDTSNWLFIRNSQGFDGHAPQI